MISWPAWYTADLAMSIYTITLAIKAANVLPLVLLRPIAEYARRNDTDFAEYLLGYNTPIAPRYSFVTDIFGNGSPRAVNVSFARYIWDGMMTTRVLWHYPDGYVEIEFDVVGLMHPLCMVETPTYIVESVCAGRPGNKWHTTEVTALATQLFAIMHKEMHDDIEGRPLIAESSPSAKKTENVAI
jgi:hypothetical protein